MPRDTKDQPFVFARAIGGIVLLGVAYNSLIEAGFYQGVDLEDAASSAKTWGTAAAVIGTLLIFMFGQRVGLAMGYAQAELDSRRSKG